MHWITQACRGPYLLALAMLVATGLLPVGTPLLAQQAPPAKGQPAKAPTAAKSPAAAVRQFRECVAFQDRGVYDLAADEWEKFLERFPQDPLAAKAQHYLGLCRLLLKQYDAASVALKKAIEKYPKSELIDESYLNLGLTQYSIAQEGKSEVYDEAIATFSGMIAKFPQSKQLGDARYYLGESLYARDKKKDAIEVYAKLIDKQPESPLRPDALYALGVTLQELGSETEAGQAFAKFIKEYPQHALYAEVLMRRAETLFSQKEFAQAEQGFREAASAPSFQMADLSTMRLAASLFAQQKIAEAAAVYVSMPEKFPKSESRVAAQLAAGNCYYLLGDFPAAEKWLTATLPSGGEIGAEAAHWLARAALKQHKPADALQVVEQALPASQATTFAVALRLDQADALYDLEGRRAESIPLYAALAKDHPKHELAPQSLYMAAFATLGEADYKAAQGYCEAFLKAYADQPLAADVRYVAAESALQLKDQAQAETLYRQLIEASPQHADVNLWKVRLGLTLSLEKKYADVVATLGPLAGELKSPELLAEAQYLLGSAQSELKQYEPALQSFEASLAAQPAGKHADEALLGLAAVQRQSNDVPAAIASLGKLLSEFPQSKLLDRAHFYLGEYSSAGGDFPAAAAEYQQVLTTWPQSPLAPHAQYGLAWTQLARKDYAGAAKTYDALIEKNSQHAVAAKARYARAMAREQLKDYSGAEQDLVAFLATNPVGRERLDAIYLQGLCAAGLNQFDRAIELFRSILAADSKFVSADKVLYELAWALKSANKPSESLETFQTLAHDHADSPLAAESLYYIGEHLYGDKKFAEAAASYTAAMNRAGKTELGERAGHKLGWTYYQQGQFDRAQEVFQTQLDGFPQGELAAEGRFMLGESLFYEKKYSEAQAAYALALEHPPAGQESRALLHLHAAQTLAQSKQWAESLGLLESGLKQFPESAYLPEMLYESGWAQQNLGKREDAIARYEKAAAASDREVSARARFMIGEILFEQQQYKEAVRNYFKVAYGYGYPESSEAIRAWQANAAFEAGRSFEMLRAVDQAKKAFREVVEKYPQSDKSTQAKAHLQALGN